ncbi:MAG: sensor histidine kinase [Cyclobacteriaceae bacterium]|nr:sensor histidine kinase [Cyclobacteriaceae bacterium]
MSAKVRYLILAMFAVIFSPVSGQNFSVPYTDSLLKIFNKPQQDSTSAQAIMLLQRYYFERGQYDSSLKYARQAVGLTKRLLLQKQTARAYYNMGMTYTNLANYDSARFYLDTTFDYWPVLRDTLLQVSALHAMGILNNYQSDYSTAVEYLLEAEELINQSGSPDVRKLFPQILNSLSRNLNQQKQYDRGIAYARKALGITGFASENRYRTILHLELAHALLQIGDLQLSKTHLDSARSYNRTLDNIVITNFVYTNEGNYYQAIGDMTKALSAYREAYRLSKQTNNDYLIASAANSLANACYLTGRYDEAHQLANEVITLGKRLKQYEEIAGAYDVLRHISVSRGDYRSALEYAEKNKVYADSSTNSETQKKILSLESRYRHQKREQELATLKSVNAERELEVVRKNRMFLVLGISSVALIVILIVFVGYSKQKQTVAEKERKIQENRVKFLENQQRLVSMQAMINGQETERTRIARDLHDGLGGMFSTIKMYMSTLEHEQPGLQQHDLFRKSYALVDNTAEEMRRIAHNMMPEVLMKLGLVNALQDLCMSISAGKLLKVSLEIHGLEQRLSSSTEVMLFRIVQELLNNIIKHAHATEAIIQFIREGNRLSVMVEDNGRGFDTERADKAKQAGLETIENRVAYLNGKLSIDSQKDVGTTVMMDFLLNEHGDI